MDTYTIDESGALSYICVNGKRMTGGHHRFILNTDGSITGQLGASMELVMTKDKQFISESGAAKIEKEEAIQKANLLNRLNRND